MKIIILDASNTVSQKIEALVEELSYENCTIEIFVNAEDALDDIRENGVDIIFGYVGVNG
jgi:two-component SAPR family response regulator